MRLRFLGDQPPHPFFLDDVSRVLSLKLSCVRVFLLTKECCVRIGNVVDDDARTTTSIKEDLTDETTTRDTIDVCSRVIETIVRGSVRYELDGDALRKELERMGLPKEHVDAIARPYEENVDRMRKAMLKKVIRIGRDEGDGGISCSWEIVARTVDTTKTQDVAPDVRVKVSISGCTFSADELDLRMCINEMKSARAAMNE